MENLGEGLCQKDKLKRSLIPLEVTSFSLYFYLIFIFVVWKFIFLKPLRFEDSKVDFIVNTHRSYITDVVRS